MKTIRTTPIRKAAPICDGPKNFQDEPSVCSDNSAVMASCSHSITHAQGALSGSRYYNIYNKYACHRQALGVYTAACFTLLWPHAHIHDAAACPWNAPQVQPTIRHPSRWVVLLGDVDGLWKTTSGPGGDCGRVSEGRELRGEMVVSDGNEL